MELYHLISFKAVAEEKHLTRAAKKLFISQSALSAQIITLEKELDTRLFLRTAKGMELTDYGEVTLEYAKKILSLSKGLEEEIKKQKGEKQNILKIGLQTDPSFLRIDNISKELSCKIPNLNVNYIGTRTEFTCDLLTKRKIDIGFVYGAIEDKLVDALELFDVPTCIVIPRKFIRDQQEPDLKTLVNLPFIWFEEDCPFYTVLNEYFSAAGFKVEKRVHSSDEGSILDFLKNEIGLALIREDQAMALKKEMDIVIWDNERIHISLSLIWLKKRAEERLIKQYIKTAKNVWCC